MVSSGSADKTVRLWDTRTGKELRTLAGHSDWVISVAFMPNSTMFASASWDNTVKLWDVGIGKCVAYFPAMDNLYSVAMTREGKIAAGGATGIVYILQASNLHPAGHST
nr:hypothetical protein [Candidatus Sigynarchaeota archaeon]